MIRVSKFEFDSPFVAPKIEKFLKSLFLIFVFSLTESGLDDVYDSLAGADVGKDLTATGGVLGSFLEDDNLRLLCSKARITGKRKQS